MLGFVSGLNKLPEVSHARIKKIQVFKSFTALVSHFEKSHQHSNLLE